MNLKYNKIILLFLFVITVSACDKPIPRYPVHYKTDTHFNSIIEQNKMMVHWQDEAFKYYINQHPNTHFINSKQGFWYSYDNQNKKSDLHPKIGDRVIYTYQISDLQNQIIYTTDEIGDLNYKIDKETIITGLQEGLKLMKPNEVVTFLFPSFLAYGIIGDRKKIKTNQPLIYTVYLKKIITSKQ